MAVDETVPFSLRTPVTDPIKVQVLFFTELIDVELDPATSPQMIIRHLYAKSGYDYHQGWELVSKNRQTELVKHQAFKHQRIKDGDVLIIRELDV